MKTAYHTVFYHDFDIICLRNSPPIVNFAKHIGSYFYKFTLASGIEYIAIITKYMSSIKIVSVMDQIYRVKNPPSLVHFFNEYGDGQTKIDWGMVKKTILDNHFINSNKIDIPVLEQINIRLRMLHQYPLYAAAPV